MVTNKELKDRLASAERERDLARQHPGMGSAHVTDYLGARERDVQDLRDKIEKQEKEGD